MKIKKYLLSFSAVALITASGIAQTPEQRKQITRDYNKKELRSIAEEYGNIFTQQRQKALNYAKANDIPTVITKENGEKSYLHRMDEHGNLIYYKNNSIIGAKTIGVDKLWDGEDGLVELQGEDMFGGVWDGGVVRETHELLEGKVTIGDSLGSVDDHATHVTGIMIGRELTEGEGVEARGMANKAEAISYDWFGDLNQMLAEASGGLLVSNHSYGMDLSKVPNPASYVGRYDSKSSTTDYIIHSTPKYTVVTSAGNDRFPAYLNPNPEDGGYNILGGEMTTAKNTIVVSAVGAVPVYAGPGSVSMSSFSSWGPTNDFRVKPDIAANGVAVFSSLSGSDTQYGASNGTSMAAPSVAGGLLLVQELAADLHDGEYLSSAMLKAIMIETARQADNVLGPDARYGWGLMAVDKMVELMLDANNDGNSFYEESTLDGETTTYTRNIGSVNDDELKITIAWIDPKGDAQGFGDDSPVLVNDLDLRIVDTQGNTYYPWRLDPSSFEAAPLRDGDNSVDNVEQVLISDPDPTERYTIKVTYKGELKGGEQTFAIAGTGTELLGVEDHKLSGFSIYPNPASDQVNLNLEKSGEEVAVEVFDINGRKVIQTKFEGASNFNESLNVSNLNSGVYFVKVNTDGKMATQKLIIK